MNKKKTNHQWTFRGQKENRKTQRYKMIGNAVTVDVVEAIGKK